jgi:hypothetical protein
MRRRAGTAAAAGPSSPSPSSSSSSSSSRRLVGAIVTVGLAGQAGLLGLFEHPPSPAPFGGGTRRSSEPRQRGSLPRENLLPAGLVRAAGERQHTGPSSSTPSLKHPRKVPTAAKQGKRDAALAQQGDRSPRDPADRRPRHDRDGDGDPALPRWIRRYLEWHASARRQFPGASLWDDPRAPKLLVRTCLGSCGGLNDRLGQLPWDVYVASRTGRVLLLHWHRPVPISHFLLPREVDWTVPSNVPGFEALAGPSSSSASPPSPNASSSAAAVTYTREQMGRARAHPDLFAGYASGRPGAAFWDRDLDAALHRAASGEFRTEKLLRLFLLGHVAEGRLEDRLRREEGEAAAGEEGAAAGSSAAAAVHWDAPAFGALFRAFFRPSPGVEAALLAARSDLGLAPGRYSAVHCRVRHPKAPTPPSSGGAGAAAASKDPAHRNADKSGLEWRGRSRSRAIRTAARALRCARTLSAAPGGPPSGPSLVQDEGEALYFFSDSIDLVRHVSSDPLHVAAPQQEGEGDAIEAAAAEADAREASRGVRVVSLLGSNASSYARRVLRAAGGGEYGEKDVAHLDKNKGRPPEDYYPTFVDFWLASEARCVTYGVGFYGALAAKVSGTSCRLLHENEAWGDVGDKASRTPQCILPP